MNNIIVNIDTLKKVNVFLKEEKEKYRNRTLNHIFDSGTINVSVKDFQDYIKFKRKGNTYYLEVIFCYKKSFLVTIGTLEIDVLGYENTIIRNIKLSENKKLKDSNIFLSIPKMRQHAKDFINILFYIDIKTENANIIYCEKEDCIKKQNEKNKNITQKSSYNPTKEKNIYIDLEEYIYIINSNGNKNNIINRKTESWGVRGHYRRIKDKDGKIVKKVFVKPYIKGIKNTKVKEKNYILQ